MEDVPLQASSAAEAAAAAADADAEAATAAYEAARKETETLRSDLAVGDQRPGSASKNKGSKPPALSAQQQEIQEKLEACEARTAALRTAAAEAPMTIAVVSPADNPALRAMPRDAPGLRFLVGNSREEFR